MSGEDCRNKWVFSQFSSNTSRDSAGVISQAVFQSLQPATANERSPTVTSCDRGMTSSEEVDAIPATGNGLGFKQLPWILINININQYKILLIIHHDTDQVSWSKHRENRPQAGWVDLVVVHWQRLKPLELPGQDQAESHGTPLHAHTHSAFITSPRPAASWSKKPLSGPLSFCNVFGFCWPILINFYTITVGTDQRANLE